MRIENRKVGRRECNLGLSVLDELIGYNVLFATELTYVTCHLLRCSSLGQTLQVSTYFWEIIFALAIIIAGLLLFALLIGNMQVGPLRRNCSVINFRTVVLELMRSCGHVTAMHLG